MSATQFFPEKATCMMAKLRAKLGRVKARLDSVKIFKYTLKPLLIILRHLISQHLIGYRVILNSGRY